MQRGVGYTKINSKKEVDSSETTLEQLMLVITAMKISHDISTVIGINKFTILDMCGKIIPIQRAVGEKKYFNFVSRSVGTSRCWGVR